MFRLYSLVGILLLIGSYSLSAQSAKKQVPPQQDIPAESIRLYERPHSQSVPTQRDPFDTGVLKYRAIGQLNMEEHARTTAFSLQDEATALPYFLKQKTEASLINAESGIAAQAVAYAASLDLPMLDDAATEFVVMKEKVDAAGNQHIRLQQVWQGIPIYGAEIIVHSHAGVFDMMNGRYVPSPKSLTSIIPTIEKQGAITLVRTSMQDTRVWTAADLKLVNGKTHEADLVVFLQNETPRLAWHIIARPDPMHRTELMLDAHSGEVLQEFDHTCKIDGGRMEGHLHDHVDHTQSHTSVPASQESNQVMGPITGSGLDLLNINRTFGAYEVGGTVFMEDTRKSMFNAAASQFPDDPIGVIITLDAQNTSPQNSNFSYSLVTSNSANFNDKRAVSAHWNSNQCYDYFENTFSRASIDGLKGNILALVNVSETNGASMENAFWNGEAMWYGNGGSTFFPLAAGLDVGGHEMTHGVVEKTANLIYQNESGALNESFADIFGVMIDRDDWKIGEDVMKPGASPNNALRSMEDPHNGGNSLNDPFWQPKHYNERYTGSQDNGGVHINSGITNYAFYLFATSNGVGKDKAERVYYKALDEYLVKSSRFVDCRAAVVQAAVDLYGNGVATAAAAAFDAVGIAGANPGGGGGNPNPGGDYLGNLNPNTGTEYLLVTTEDRSTLQLATAAGNVLGDLYTDGVASRPSVTDNGSEIVFINDEGHIVDIFLEYTSMNITPTTNIISPDPVWRNVAISKDGRFIAALTNNQDNTINVFDFGVSPVASKSFSLYNPTFTSSGQVTNNVNYADVLAFDYSGEYLMYDAENALNGGGGQDLTYWDIGFLQFFDNNQFTDGQDDISKLFNGLPEGLSVGNPVFSKNSPYIIAFDLIDGIEGRYDIFGANVETGDNGAIIVDNGDLGYPDYNHADQSIVFESPFSVFGTDLYRQGVASSKIAAAGQTSSILQNHVWGVWFANGTRSLLVDADDVQQEAHFTISPNPVQAQTAIMLTAAQQSDAQILVFDVAGKQVLSKNIEVQAGENRIELDMAALKAGTYFVTLASDTQRAVVPVVKL